MNLLNLELETILGGLFVKYYFNNCASKRFGGAVQLLHVAQRTIFKLHLSHLVQMQKHQCRKHVSRLAL